MSYITVLIAALFVLLGGAAAGLYFLAKYLDRKAEKAEAKLEADLNAGTAAALEGLLAPKQEPPKADPPVVKG